MFTFSYKLRVSPNTELDSSFSEGWISCEAENCLAAAQTVWASLGVGYEVLAVLEFRSVSEQEFKEMETSMSLSSETVSRW